MLPMISAESGLFPIVSEVQEINDEMGHQLRVMFHNGYELSIVANPGFGSGFRYACGDEFEIAVFNPKGNFTQRFFPDYHSDDVMGYLTISEISNIAFLIANA